MAKGKTPAPSGFKISRSGKTFYLSWKIVAKNSNDSQKRRWRYSNGSKWSKWSTASIGKTATSCKIDINYYPIKAVQIQVQDDQKKNGKKVKNLSASAWAGATFTLYGPPKSVASITLDSDRWNACSVSWGHEGNAFSAGDNYWYLKTEYQTTFHDEKSEDVWGDANGNEGQTTIVQESGSLYKQEESLPLASGLGYVRRYRFRIQDKVGYNGWATCSHYYSTPYTAVVKTATISKNEAGGIDCSVTWNSPSNAFHPIDFTSLQYGITVPGENMSCPSGISWTERPTMLDTSGEKDDGDSFAIDTMMDPDQCLFVRVVNQHDNNRSYSVPMLATGIVTVLTTPSGFTIDPNFDTYRVTVGIDNESQVPDSRIAIVYHSVLNGVSEDRIIGILGHSETSKTIQCPNFDIPDEWSLGAYAFVGEETYESITYTVGSNNYTYLVYEIPDMKMKSQTLWQGGDIPRAPGNVMAVSPREGVALVTWDWAWKSADIAELSWSDHDDAWESTDQPETYRIPNNHAAKWSIYGLDSGTTWYIRVRLIKTTDGGENAGPWSDAVDLDMASAPNIPILTCSKLSVTHNDSFTVSWEYDSTDGTDQKDAVLIPVTVSDSGEISYGEVPIRKDIGTSRSVDLIPDNIEGWETGNRYGFALKVVSESGKQSEWSDPQFITVAEPLVCSINTTSFDKRYLYSITADTEEQPGKTYYTLTSTAVVTPDINDISTYYELSNGVYSLTDDGVIDTEKTYYTVEGSVASTFDVSTCYDRVELNILKAMPISLSASVSGGIDNGYNTNISISRATPYFVNRPDESVYSGHEGETVYSSYVENPESIVVNQSDLIGYLDDTAGYILTVYAYDDLDQVAEDSVIFFVNWSHQATIPGATVEFDDEYAVVKITPTIDPEKYEEGDTFDIYRLSVDKPVLIVKGGSFGETYVDPFPTIGRFGGHRVVTITANGDFISNDEESDMAWIDLGAEDGDIFNTDFPIINYGEGSYEILYNVDLSTQWTKDFRETRYLGGHIQGDWNDGVSRASTINSVTIREDDIESMTAFRRLAEYTGACHVRTLDGSNYYADVQVSETIPSDDNPLNSYSFKITRVEADGYDGIELSEWNKMISG